MASPIDTAFEQVTKSIQDMRKDNDASLEELKKGNDARYRELQEVCARQDATITDLVKTKNDLLRQKALVDERIEVLESVADRPKGDIVKKMVDEDLNHFEKWVRSGFKDREAQAAREKLKAKELELKVDTVTSGTALLGGNAVPKVISDAIERLVLKTSGVVDAIGMKTVGTSDYHRVVTISGQSGSWAAELGSRSQGNAPNTRDIKPTQGELYSFLYATKESMMDMAFDVQSWLINDVAECQAVQLATAIYNGNGTAKPTGIINATAVSTADYASPMRAAAAYQYVSHLGVDTSSPNKLTLDILQAAISTLAPGYRSGSKFAMSSLTQGIARRLKDTTGQYLWQPSVQADQPDMLFGYPVFTWEDLVSGNTVDGLVAAFGNWPRAYELVARGPLEIVVDNLTTIGTTKFWVSRRFGGIPCNNDALKLVKNAD